MRPDDIFEALSDIDEDLIAGAKHIEGGDSQVIVIKRAPLWKTIAGWGAAAACLAVLVVGGIFGIKYFSGRSAALDSDMSGASDTSICKSDCHAYYPPEYPKEAKYVYTGDYSELEVVQYGEIDRLVFADIEYLEEQSDLIVIGEFTDDPHQCVDPSGKEVTQVLDRFDQQNSFNRFRIDRVIKGNCFEGEEIIIAQNGYVDNGRFAQYSNLTPMLKGDKWVYFLTRYSGASFYSPLGYSDGRYPVPGTEHEFVLCDNVYGVFDMIEFRSGVYEAIKERLPDWTYKVYFCKDYPDNASEVYDGDYSGLKLSASNIFKPEHTFDEVYNDSEFIVTGEFIDDVHQSVYYYENTVDMVTSYNKFRVDKVYKGDVAPGEIIIIRQSGGVVGDTYYMGNNPAPMIKGDKWLYCLDKSQGICYPGTHGDLRFPIPGVSNTHIDIADNDLGVFKPECFDNELYERLLKELGISGLEIIASENFDGVVLTVMTNGKSFAPEDEIYVTATVQNNTDKPIGLLMPVWGENTHTEIDTRITRGLYSLTDISVTGVGGDAMHSHIIEPGEEYVQNMTFKTNFKGEVGETGEYKGMAAICLLDDPNDVGSRATVRLVEFSLMIGEETADRSIEKVYDGDVDSDTVGWTMDEFPGVTFSCDGDSVTALTEGVKDTDGNEVYASQTLYSGMPVCNVYLADLNFDGKREIISTVCMGSGIVDVHIEAYDYAGNVHYTLENRMYCDYALKEDGGRLIVQTSRYMENEVMTEETLSLDMMYGHTIDNPVAVISRSSDVSWVMEEFPGVTFYAGFLGISAEKDGTQTPIYKDVIVYDVMLCDINNDGKREIITQIKKSTDGHDAVRAYDYANGVCYEYSSDEMDNMLRYYNGELSVCVYTGGTLFTEFELTKPIEEEIAVPADKPEGLILPLRSFTGYSDLNEKTSTDFPSFYRIGTTKDEPVYAVASGEVIDASGMKIEGFDDVPHDYTAILGEDGKYYYYGSLGETLVKAGDKVTAGQRIGTAGAYGEQYGEYAFGLTFVCANEPIN